MRNIAAHHARTWCGQLSACLGRSPASRTELPLLRPASCRLWAAHPFGKNSCRFPLPGRIPKTGNSKNKDQAPRLSKEKWLRALAILKIATYTRERTECSSSSGDHSCDITPSQARSCWHWPWPLAAEQSRPPVPGPQADAATRHPGSRRAADPDAGVRPRQPPPGLCRRHTPGAAAAETQRCWTCCSPSQTLLDRRA